MLNGTHFDIEEGRLEGWDDAVIHQSKSDWSNPAPGAFIEYTSWVDVFAEPSTGEECMAGLWYTDIASKLNGYTYEIERYKLLYNCDDSTVYLIIETDRYIKDLGDDKVLGSLKLEREPGANYGGDPVRLGFRVESGKLTAYADGKVVCEHSYNQIGQDYSAMILNNNGCLAAFDNFFVGDLEENVAWRTLSDDEIVDIPGDITCDGIVNAKDVCALMTLMVEGPVAPDDCTDYNGDGKVNCLDLIEMMLDIVKKHG